MAHELDLDDAVASVSELADPQPGSPNWYWSQAGCTVERRPGHKGLGTVRTVRRPDGSLVDTGDGSHEDEVAVGERELSRINNRRGYDKV